MNPLTGLSTGIRCWPQWKNWGFCYQTGALVDPNGQLYQPGQIQGGAYLLQLQDLRDRVIFADVAGDHRVLATRDMGTLPANPLRELRERQHQAHAAARLLAQSLQATQRSLP